MVEREAIAVRPKPVLYLAGDEQDVAFPAERESGFEIGTFTPPSPWIGSMMNAQVCGPRTHASASRSRKGTRSKSGMNGAKPSRYAFVDEVLIAVIVRPWKLPFATTIHACEGAIPLTRYPSGGPA
jgi:hypothetical protein